MGRGGRMHKAVCVLATLPHSTNVGTGRSIWVQSLWSISLKVMCTCGILTFYFLDLSLGECVTVCACLRLIRA